MAVVQLQIRPTVWFKYLSYGGLKVKMYAFFRVLIGWKFRQQKKK